MGLARKGPTTTDFCGRSNMQRVAHDAGARLDVGGRVPRVRAPGGRAERERHRVPQVETDRRRSAARRSPRRSARRRAGPSSSVGCASTVAESEPQTTSLHSSTAASTNWSGVTVSIAVSAVRLQNASTLSARSPWSLRVDAAQRRSRGADSSSSLPRRRTSSCAAHEARMALRGTRVVRGSRRDRREHALELVEERLALRPVLPGHEHPRREAVEPGVVHEHRRDVAPPGRRGPSRTTGRGPRSPATRSRARRSRAWSRAAPLRPCAARPPRRARRRSPRRSCRTPSRARRRRASARRGADRRPRRRERSGAPPRRAATARRAPSARPGSR